MTSIAQKSHTYIAHYTYPFHGAQAFKIPSSGVLIYVESDGRHLAAISPDGKLLWNKDPFLEAKLQFYRIEKPQVIYIGKPNVSHLPKGDSREGFVAVALANSQFGLIRVRTGEFIFEGQD